VTRGRGRTIGFRAQDSDLRPGVVVQAGPPAEACPPCLGHRHGGCLAHLAAVADAEPVACECDCHYPLEDFRLSRAALDDMDAHGTLADYVAAQQRGRAGQAEEFARVVAAMIEDPDLTGDLLLVGIYMARVYLLREPDLESLPMDRIARAVMPRGSMWYRSRQVLRLFKEDIRRYEPERNLMAADLCRAPMIRRAGECGQRANGGDWVTDPATGERTYLGACSRPEHHEWVRGVVANNREELERHPAPAAAANTGGVLTRHLPELNWEKFWRKVDPRWTPPPENEPRPASPRFELLVNVAPDGDDPEPAGGRPALTKIDGGWR
jgi:hypothetical protein